MKSMFGGLRRSLAAGSISIGLLLSFTVATATAQIWNTNLVTNGDAEAGPSAVDRTATPITNIPGWTRSGTFTVIKYGSPQLFGISNYGPSDRKSQYFCGGPNGGTAKAEQTIDLSAGAAEIDAGRVRFYLEAYLSNANENRDVMPNLTAVFYDSAGKAILTHKAVAQSKEDIRDGMGWSGGSGFLLPDTRKVTLTLDLSRPATGFNYTAADNISLKLAVEPLMGANLVWNGAGEDTTGESSQNTAKPVPGWNGDLDFGVSLYGSVMRTTDAGPTDRGKNYFFARTNTTAEVFQRIDLTLAKDRIDSGNVSYKLAAWIGGTSRAQNDAASVKLTFFNASGVAVGQPVTLGPVLGVDRAISRRWYRSRRKGMCP